MTGLCSIVGRVISCVGSSSMQHAREHQLSQSGLFRCFLNLSQCTVWLPAVLPHLTSASFPAWTPVLCLQESIPYSHSLYLPVNTFLQSTLCHRSVKEQSILTLLFFKTYFKSAQPCFQITSLKNISSGAGELARCLRTLTALAENPEFSSQHPP